MSNSDDEIIEEESEEGPAAQKRLREKLKKAVAEKQEYLEGWQRARADFANYKRQEAEIQADREARIKMEVFEKLLPALNALEQGAKSSSFQRTPQDFQQGFKKIWEEFIKNISQLGIDSGMKWTWDLPQIGWLTGEDMSFDPNKHEALKTVPTDKPYLDHQIAEVYRAGYSVNDQVIQPTQVAIYTYQPK